MDEATRTFTAICSDVALVRRALSSRVRLVVQEKRRRLLWRVFTITGPADVIDAAVREIETELEEIAMDARVW